MNFCVSSTTIGTKDVKLHVDDPRSKGQALGSINTDSRYVMLSLIFFVYILNFMLLRNLIVLLYGVRKTTRNPLQPTRFFGSQHISLTYAKRFILR